MRFSNFLFPASMEPGKDQQIIQETMREARLCDELGMEMLWLAEHHFDGICAYVDPVTFAAALAASTERVHIGFAVAQMSLHHPVREAEQIMIEAWAGEDYQHRGRFWNLRLPRLRPLPYTRPHPRIIRACSGEAATLDMARAGRPFLMNVQSNEVTRHRMDRYRQTMRECGFDEATIAQ